MNNLKRVLSLALSGIMLVGMMAMGASAADFTDAEEIQHVDAVNVLVALKVINGQDDGSFNPQGDVTRGQMAKMIAVAMNGGSDANTGVKGTASFTDIKGHWAESYIEYCADLGIISGRGDGTFDPDGKVTGIEATKMVLTALGYDAKAYELTGAKWATQTDQLARQADPNLYDELAGVAMATNASREVAAQLIWNGLQNEVVRIQPNEGRNDGTISWNYGKVVGTTLLSERYDGRIWTGTYAGNSDSMTLDAGSIRIINAAERNASVAAHNQTATFPSDMGIENIGEEVMVVFKDGRGGTAGRPDKWDTIYGVFNTGKTQVYKIIADDLQTDATNEGKGRIKFNDALHDVASTGIVAEYNYDANTDTAAMTAGSTRSTLAGLPAATEIKFVCDTEGKISAAYVTTFGINKVTGLTSTTVTINGVGSISIADNDIYKDIAKNDIVVYTKFYSADKDDAFFTVKKAETIEGKMTGFKNAPEADGTTGVYQNIVIDDTTYNVNDPKSDLDNVGQDDAVTDLNDLGETGGQASIGDSVRLYMVGKFVGVVSSIETSGGKYAIVTEVSNGANDSVDSNMNPLKVTVMLADGTTQTVNVHKDSSYAAAVSGGDNGKFSGKNHDTQYGKFAGAIANKADLIEYSSISSGTIKIKTVMSPDSNVVGNNEVIWNEDTKKLTFHESGAWNSAVAANDAMIFVGVDSSSAVSNTTPDGEVDKFYAYDLRSLGELKDTYKESASSYVGTKISYFKDSRGLIKAAYITMNSRPGSSSADTLYGIVTSYVGSRVNKDGDDLYTYKVAVGRDEAVTVNVETETPGDIQPGDLVVFDERSDGEYNVAKGEIVKLIASDGTVNTLTDGGAGMVLLAVREWNERTQLLTGYYDTARASATEAFEGTPASYTVSKDVKLIYVNAADKKQGDEIGLNSFNPDNGYANALLHTDKDGVVDAIIVETSGKANLAVAGSNKKVNNTSGAQTFGVKSNTLTVSAGAISGTHNANYAITMGSNATGVEVGASFTVSVTCNSLAAGTTETVTLTYNGVTVGTMTFTTANTTQSVSVTAVAGATSVTATVTA